MYWKPEPVAILVQRAHPPVVSVGHPHNRGHGVVYPGNHVLEIGAPQNVKN
jgi:hypothetical protein